MFYFICLIIYLFLFIYFKFLLYLNLIKYCNWNFLRVFLINLATVFGFVHCCYISALMLTCFRLMNDHATYFQPRTIFASFLYLYGVIIQSVIQSFTEYVRIYWRSINFVCEIVFLEKAWMNFKMYNKKII